MCLANIAPATGNISIEVKWICLPHCKGDWLSSSDLAKVTFQHYYQVPVPLDTWALMSASLPETLELKFTPIPLGHFIAANDTTYSECLQFASSLQEQPRRPGKPPTLSYKQLCDIESLHRGKDTRAHAHTRTRPSFYYSTNTAAGKCAVKKWWENGKSALPHPTFS